MENYIGKICPFCKTEITEADAVKVCPACGIPHHEGCWEENHGCTTFGCSEQHYEAQHTNPTDVCANCGAPLGDGQAFCPKCGTPKAAAPQKNVCGKCGNELQDGQEFCPKCGQRAGLTIESGVSSAINQFNAGVQQTAAKKKKTPLIIGIAVAIVAVVIAIITLGGGDKGPGSVSKKDFNDLYPTLGSEKWCTIASDGSYLKIDTNPNNKDGDDLTWGDYESFVIPANDMIEQINKDLGFSEALYEKMNTTTWSQGKQTDSNENYTVTWTYHPDKGLEVMYEMKGK